jgi:hypothetical protein
MTKPCDIKAEFDAKKFIDRPTKSILRGQSRTPKLRTRYSRVWNEICDSFRLANCPWRFVSISGGRWRAGSIRHYGLGDFPRKDKTG